MYRRVLSKRLSRNKFYRISDSSIRARQKLKSVLETTSGKKQVIQRTRRQLLAYTRPKSFKYAQRKRLLSCFTNSGVVSRRIWGTYSFRKVILQWKSLALALLAQPERLLMTKAWNSLLFPVTSYGIILMNIPRSQILSSIREARRLSVVLIGTELRWLLRFKTAILPECLFKLFSLQHYSFRRTEVRWLWIFSLAN